jgi:hypothetical protein
MDPNLIYAKTASGEEAMRQRTRVVQRNMRMVLILVDGNATVADLSAKTGNIQLVESALHELEQSGFIELRVEQDSVWEQSKKVAAEIKAAAIGYTAQRPVSTHRDEVVHIAPSISPVSIFPRPQVAESMLSQFSIAPVHSTSLSANSAISIFGADGPATPLQAPLHQDGVKPAPWLERLKTAFAARQKSPVDDGLAIKPIRRGGDGYYIGWPIKFVFAALGLLAAIFLTALLFPYGSYLPEVEAALTQVSGQPAKIGEMRASFYPKPGLILNNVRLGNAATGSEISIMEVRLVPLPSTVMAPRKVFSEAVLTGVTLPAEALAGLVGIFESAAQPSAKASVRNVILEKTDISFRGLGFSELNGEVKLTPDGRFQMLSMHSPNRSVQIEAKPSAKGIDINLEAYAWRPSPASLLLVDSATVQGNLDGGELTLRKLNMRVFDGLVDGVAILRSEKQPEITGQLSFERINAKRLGEFVGIGPQFEGEMAGKMMLSATADAWPDIFSATNANGEFSMRRGGLGAIDLTEAARRASTTPIQGGSTRFEQLSGVFSFAPSGYRFSNLVLTSGLMQSFGQVDINRDLQLNGRIEVQMSGTVNKLRMPLLISGPLKTPSLQAAKR